MVQHLPRTAVQAVGRRCNVTNLVCFLAAWILLVQIYTLFAPLDFTPSGSNRQQGRTLYNLEDVPLTGKLVWGEERAAGKHLFPDKSLAVNPLRANSSDRMYYYPGREWRDTQGRPIQAHGGGVLFDDKSQTFFWYGENKDGRTYHIRKGALARVDVLGVNCYSSKDLWNWKFEGTVLKPDTTDEESDLHVSKVVERPKVIYNERTDTYVMWMHVDSANYSKASVGIAVSGRPQGPFRYLGSRRPHGYDSRDMTIFKDDDKRAYVIYSALDNTELHVGVMTDNYLALESNMTRVFIKQKREAPAVFKNRGNYYMITSGCTGWAPNGALVHASESMMGLWETLGNPCVGGSSDFTSKTFYAQGTFVLPVPGIPDYYVFMADRWKPSDLRDSRYVWLPLTLDGPVDEPLSDFIFPLWSRVSIRWHNRWKLPDRELSGL